MRLLLALTVVAAIALPAQAAPKLTAADRAWIDACVSDRKQTGRSAKMLRAYCVCMQEVVEDNQPLGITELERSYPPAHLACRRQAGMR
jgi:hypothetical protein